MIRKKLSSALRGNTCRGNFKFTSALRLSFSLSFPLVPPYKSAHPQTEVVHHFRHMLGILLEISLDQTFPNLRGFQLLDIDPFLFALITHMLASLGLNLTCFIFSAFERSYFRYVTFRSPTIRYDLLSYFHNELIFYNINNKTNDGNKD